MCLRSTLGLRRRAISHPLSTLDKLQERRKRRTRRGRGSPGQQEATPQRPQERNREASVPPAKGCRAPRRGTCREGHPRRSRPPLCPHVKTPVLPQRGREPPLGEPGGRGPGDTGLSSRHGARYMGKEAPPHPPFAGRGSWSWVGRGRGRLPELPLVERPGIRLMDTPGEEASERRQTGHARGEPSSPPPKHKRASTSPDKCRPRGQGTAPRTLCTPS